MSGNEVTPVAVSRRISAPAAVIFRILADPSQHTRLDGTDMLRGAVTTDLISGIGDVFIMRMFFPRHGDYEMNNHIVEFELNRRIGWEPAAGRGHPGSVGDDAAGERWGHRWTFDLVPDGPDATIVTESYDCTRAPAEAQAGMDGGRVWLTGMTRTLELLEESCTRASPAAG